MDKLPIQRDIPFRSQYNFVLQEDDVQFNDEPSLTIPDEALTVKELLERFSVGAPLSIRDYDDGYPSSEPSFDDEDYSSYSKIELEQLRLDTQDEISYLNNNLKRIEDEKRVKSFNEQSGETRDDSNEG